MSEPLSIKIQIAGRSYPLKIEADQEGAVLEAIEIIRDNMKAYEKEYGVRDQQDLLAMCALQLATEQIKLRSSDSGQKQLLARELNELSGLLEKELT